MQQASSDLVDQFPDFLARLPAEVKLEELARQTGAFGRPRGVRSGTDLLRLALAWGPGGYSMQRVVAWAGELGFAELTDEALSQRLHGAVSYLQAVTNQLLQRVAEDVRWPGRVLRIADSSSLSGPASHGTDWRLHGVYDLARGGFVDLELTDGHGAEALDRGKPVAGEIRIADRGYANAQAWQRFLQASAGQADYIVRMRWNTVRLVDGAGDLFDIIGWLKALPQAQETHEKAVWAQSGKGQRPLRIRLIARRKTPEAITAAHKDLRQQASSKQTRLDERTLVAAEFLILATSLPQAEFPAV